MGVAHVRGVSRINRVGDVSTQEIRSPFHFRERVMKIKALVFALTLVSLSLTASAQTSRGAVSGAVTDPTGAVISGAGVTLTSVATSVSRSTVTNGDGLYRFDACARATYSINLPRPALGPCVKNNTAVSANQTPWGDAQPAPGTQELTGDVPGESGAPLQTEARARGGNIDATRLTELPIA